MNTLTTENLVDYLVNADLEIQLANYDWSTICESITTDFPEYEFTPELIDSAVQLARQDPIIAMSMQRFGCVI